MQRRDRPEVFKCGDMPSTIGSSTSISCEGAHADLQTSRVTASAVFGGSLQPLISLEEICTYAESHLTAHKEARSNDRTPAPQPFPTSRVGWFRPGKQ